MSNYIVYDRSTGKINKTGSCPEEMMELQAGENEAVMEGQADDSKQYIVGGAVVEFSAAMKEEKATIEHVRQAAADKETIIRQKMDDILRKQAITELTKEGKL